MKTIHKTYRIHASVEKVWDALMNPKSIEKWGGGPAVMSDKEDEAFSLWGGDIHGKNTRVVFRQTLKQDWYSGDWPEASKLKIALVGKNGMTILELIHENVPDKEAAGIDDGWDRYYLGPLKELLER